MDTFIHQYKNAYTPEYCNKLIDLYNASEESGHTQTRQQAEGVDKLDKADKALFVNELPLNYFPQFKEFHDTFWNLYEVYAKKFSVLNNMQPHKIYAIKIQKTKPGEGYHIWHHELYGRDQQSRVLTFILYLNDIEHGGETEFLYQGIRVKPEQGTLLLWPAYFTHTHRGNPPLQETKYILTGWVEF
jgi:Rps23 Pro-64 3,4-dihydroxylase Tpa1-like proline 4-hydroxylase